MKIDNRHERNFQGGANGLGIILATLSGSDDRLWPGRTWPPMLFDTGLRVGARGGHGTVRYVVEEYVTGRRVSFRFDGTGLTAGLDGRHYFEIVQRNRYAILRHVVDAECGVGAWLKWKVVIEPLHDALLEDALDLAERELNGEVAKPAHWKLRVKIIRYILAFRRRRAEAASASGHRERPRK